MLQQLTRGVSRSARRRAAAPLYAAAVAPRAFSTQAGVAYTWGAGKSRDVSEVMKGGRTSSGFGEEQLSPKKLWDGSQVKDLSFGPTHAALVSDDGLVYTWGVGTGNELGHGQPETLVTEPTVVPGLVDVVQVACGRHHTMALTESGEVYTWGRGGSFFKACSLGHGNRDDCPSPMKVEGLDGLTVTQIGSGAMHCMVLTDDHRVYGWGRGEFGVLGTGGSSDCDTPEEVDTLTGLDVKKLACGSNFTAVISGDGELYVWGRNDGGQLAQSESMSMDIYAMESLPCLVEGLVDDDDEPLEVVDVACGDKHVVVCTVDHKVYQWGMRQWLAPNIVKGSDDIFTENKIVQVAAGKNYCGAVDVHGHLFTWGDGKSGSLGHGDKTSLMNPMLVAGFGPAANPDNNLGRVVRAIAGPRTLGVITSQS